MTNKNYNFSIIEIKKIDNIKKYLFYDTTNIAKQYFSYKNYKDNLVPSFMKNKEMETDKGKITLITFLFFNNYNTNEGSSSGPIIDINNYKLIGIRIHKSYNKVKNKNAGIFLCEIFKNNSEEDTIKISNKMHKINNISFFEKNHKYYIYRYKWKKYNFVLMHKKDLNENQRNEFIKKCNNIINLLSSEGLKVSITWKHGFMSRLIINILMIDSKVTKILLISLKVNHKTLMKTKDFIKHIKI